MAKTHPADEQTAAYRQVLAGAANRVRLFDTALLIFLALFLTVCGTLIYLLPQKTFSETENRSLQALPSLSVSSLSEGRFMTQLSDFYADQFPARRFFLHANSAFELAELRQETGGVLIGSGGYLIKRLEYTQEQYQTIRANLTYMAEFADRLAARSIPCTVSLAPRAIDVLTPYLPPLFDTERAEAAWEPVRDSGLSPVLFTKALTQAEEAGQQVFYRTDHHYTTYGAYIAYQALAEPLGYTATPVEDFTREVVTEAFFGTTAAAANVPFAKPDDITLFRYPEDQRYVTEIADTGTVMNGFYDWSYLSAHDAYSVFLGGNHGRVRVTDPQATQTRPTLLLIKDSFANSLVPFLAQHFDLEIVDLRYYKGSVTALAEQVQADSVLIFAGLDSLATAETFRLLRFGT